MENVNAHTHGKRTRIIVAIFCLAAAASIIYLCWPSAQQSLPMPPAPEPMDAEKVLLQAKELSGTGNINQAIALLQQYTFEHAGEITVSPTLAKLYILTGQHAKASELMATLLKAQPDNPKILWLRGELEKTSGKDPMPWFRQAAELPAADNEIHTQYALMLWDAKQYKPAEAYIKKALAGGSQDARIHQLAGHIALKEGRLEDAKTLLVYATEKDKQSAQAWADLAETCKKLGQDKQAIAALKHVLQYARGDMRKNVLFELAGMLVEQKEYMQAADTYVKAADAQPTLKRNCLLEAAKCYWRIGKYALAMKYIDIVYELQPDDQEV
ncbi:MAG TPA: tetratricopeptide repeat protein, partial [Phycisphaerae bacterium]|nr:tetratricopeptide repeat protein [Phycisphaerae bacterium]